MALKFYHPTLLDQNGTLFDSNTDVMLSFFLFSLISSSYFHYTSTFLLLPSLGPPQSFSCPSHSPLSAQSVLSSVYSSSSFGLPLRSTVCCLSLSLYQPSRRRASAVWSPCAATSMGRAAVPAWPGCWSKWADPARPASPTATPTPTAATTGVGRRQRDPGHGDHGQWQWLWCRLISY